MVHEDAASAARAAFREQKGKYATLWKSLAASSEAVKKEIEYFTKNNNESRKHHDHVQIQDLTFSPTQVRARNEKSYDEAPLEIQITINTPIVNVEGEDKCAGVVDPNSEFDSCVGGHHDIGNILPPRHCDESNSSSKFSSALSSSMTGDSGNDDSASGSTVIAFDLSHLVIDQDPERESHLSTEGKVLHGLSNLTLNNKDDERSSQLSPITIGERSTTIEHKDASSQNGSQCEGTFQFIPNKLHFEEKGSISGHSNSSYASDDESS